MAKPMASRDISEEALRKCTGQSSCGPFAKPGSGGTPLTKLVILNVFPRTAGTNVQPLTLDRKVWNALVTLAESNGFRLPGGNYVNATLAGHFVRGLTKGIHVFAEFAQREQAGLGRLTEFIDELGGRGFEIGYTEA